MTKLFTYFIAALACALLPAGTASAQGAGQSEYDIGMKQIEAKRYEEARIIMKAACDAGSVKGCTEYGNLLERSLGGAADLDGAMLVYTPACAKGNAMACAGMGGVYDKRKDYAKARTQYLKACDMGEARGCTNGGYLHEKGLGGAVDFERTGSLYSKACNMGSKFGCHNFAITHRDGLGRPADKEVALVLLTRNCDQKNYARSCYAAGLLYPKTGAQTNRLKYLGKGCDLGNADSCHNSGAVYYGRLKTSTTTSSIATNKRNALAYYKKACDLGRTKSCNISLNTASMENAAKSRAITQEWAAKSRTAKRELNAYRPGSHGCAFREFQLYSQNTASYNRAKRELDNERACVNRYVFKEARRLNAIMVKYGGYVRINSSNRKIQYGSKNGCACQTELKAAIDRMEAANRKLIARHDKRVDKANDIIRQGI